MDLYTKNGRPLQVSGDNAYSRSGHYVGSIVHDRIYDPSGHYAGTIVGDRVVYRRTQSTGSAGPSSAANRVGVARAARVGSAIMGDEPPFPD